MMVRSDFKMRVNQLFVPSSIHFDGTVDCLDKEERGQGSHGTQHQEETGANQEHVSKVQEVGQ